MQKKQNRGNSPIVYSTNPDFRYPGMDYREGGSAEGNDMPQLRITLDRRQRAGKKVTLIEGYPGSKKDLETLGRELKSACGTGGSVKDRIILLQGDWVEKVKILLRDKLTRISP
ncbi:MAG TPA: translation initiation factor [Chitinophagaceae bacterium]|nr:translation initiation factor [Chitinophagaceae bacterium]